jgi:hypothetical protein
VSVGTGVSVGVGVNVGTGVSVEVGVKVLVGDGVPVGVLVEGVKTRRVGVMEAVRVGPGISVALGAARGAVADGVGEAAAVGVASPGARRMAIRPAQ